ncbi:hypothetical protein BGZ76_002315 [Entomortierella beljakovae]|nr:hypothetical protein BGZ76_002315 [Entomortierella beljakovae]
MLGFNGQTSAQDSQRRTNLNNYPAARQYRNSRNLSGPGFHPNNYNFNRSWDDSHSTTSWDDSHSANSWDSNNNGRQIPSHISSSVAMLENNLSNINISYWDPPGGRQHRGPPQFNQQELDAKRKELDAKRKELVDKFVHFTFHDNKRPYKRMDQTIEFVEPDPFVESFSKMHPFPDSLSEDLARFGYVKPCSLIQMKHLELFNRPAGSLPLKYKSAFKRAVKHVAELIRLPEKLKMPTVESLDEVRFDPSKFPGMDYAREKLRNRREAHPTALKDARMVWDSLMRGCSIRPHDARLGGKGKLIKRGLQHGKIDADTENSMGRLILMLSHRDLLILGALEQPLTDAYLGEEWPIYIGQSWYYSGSEKFVNKMSRHAVYHCFDAKKFDAAIDGWMVKEAIKILRDQYEGGMGLEYDSLWSFVYESLVEVVICRDDGIRMQKKVGTTSGNCFNTLVQSIITLFLGYTALIFRASERLGEIGIQMVLTQCEIEVLGDDMVMALEKEWSHFTKESLAEVVRDCFDIDWSGKKSFSTERLMDESNLEDADKFKGVQFLGMHFRHQRFGSNQYAPKVVIPYRPFHESYLSLLFPKHGGYSREESWLRALGIYYNAAGNTDTYKWLEAYLDFLELAPFVRPEAWPTSMIRMITKDYWDIGIKVPPPKRITYNEWIQFACFPKNPDDD